MTMAVEAITAIAWPIPIAGRRDAVPAQSLRGPGAVDRRPEPGEDEACVRTDEEAA
jgi:hypothetical protein